MSLWIRFAGWKEKSRIDNTYLKGSMKTQTNESIEEYLSRGGTVTKLEPSHDAVQVSGDYSEGFFVPRDDKFIPMQDMSKVSILGDIIYHEGMR